MGQPFIGEIRMFGSSFAPAGWAFCDGAPIPISENEALFQLIGTTYGGDGQETFNLPDLQGRLPMHQGASPGGPTHVISEKGGVESVTLSSQQMPVHTHPFTASASGASSPNPQDNLIGSPPTLTPFIFDSAATAFTGASLQPIGGSQPHDNMMPTLTVSFIISLFGIYPNQN
jgi:microcystin-dependent protein